MSIFLSYEPMGALISLYMTTLFLFYFSFKQYSSFISPEFVPNAHWYFPEFPAVHEVGDKHDKNTERSELAIH